MNQQFFLISAIASKTANNSNNPNQSQTKKENSDESKCKFCSFPLVRGDNHEFYCGAKQIECEYCSTKLLAKELKNHYDFCINKITIDSLQYEENSIPTETNHDNYYNQNQNINNDLIKKVSNFKEEDIRKSFIFS